MSVVMFCVKKQQEDFHLLLCFFISTHMPSQTIFGGGVGAMLQR
jgi:hypothetical protein